MEGKEHAQTPRLPSNRSDLIDDLLISILARLSPLEIICTSMVCSSWNRIVRSSSHSRRAEAPWLLLPSETEEGEDVDGCHFFNVEEPREKTKIYKLKKQSIQEFRKVAVHRIIPWMAHSLRSWKILSSSFESLFKYPDSPSSSGNDSGYCALFGWRRLYVLDRSNS